MVLNLEDIPETSNENISYSPLKMFLQPLEKFKAKNILDFHSCK